MESGYIIPNIHYTTPTSKIKSLHNGRMTVATEPIKWQGDYISLNNFGFGGSNSHLVLKSNPKMKINNGIPSDNIPRLIYVSGRTEEAVNSILDYIAKEPMDAEYIGLLHEVYKYDIQGHNYRGFEILTKNGAVSQETYNYSYQSSSFWLVFGGLGSDCFENVADLMNIPIFSQTLQKCNNILSIKNIDLIKLINSTTISNCIKQSDLFVAVTSIQIAVLELLLYIDVTPKGVVGYSIGEIACAYYDGCLDLKQALLCSYYLGECSDQCQQAKGSIVYININQNEIKDLLVSGLEIVCVNWNKTILVSGPNDKIQTFIKKLNERQIISEIINNKYAYHSSYSKSIELLVLKQLKTLIPYPKQRSDKWITSLHSSDKNKTHLLTCTAEFLSAVVTRNIDFENFYKKVKSNTFALEISPNSILKYNTGHFEHMLLWQKYSSNINSLLSAIGKLYNKGHNPRIEKIYPKITFPVSRGTSMLSPLIKWNYSQDWIVADYEKSISADTTYYKKDFSINLNEKKHEYLAGHMIDGKILYPASGYLILVWETLAEGLNKSCIEISVIFENIKFLRATKLNNSTAITFTVSIEKYSGHFEIVEAQTTLATGRVYVPDNIADENLNLVNPVMKEECYTLYSRDIYKELKLRGYNYSGLFRGLNKIDTSITTGKVKWQCNWVTFIDAMIQMEFLKKDIRELLIPTSIEKLLINVDKQNEIIKADDGAIPIYNFNHINTLICGGVEMCSIKTSVIYQKEDLQEPVLELYKFIPNTLIQTSLTLRQSVRILFHIVCENYLNTSIKTAELLEDSSFELSDIITPIIIETINETNLKQSDAYVVSSYPLEIENTIVTDTPINSKTNAVVIIAANICSRRQKLRSVLNGITKGGYILAREDTYFNFSDISVNGIDIIAEHTLEHEKLILLSKSPEYEIESFIDVTDKNNQFNWLPILQNIFKSDSRPCIYSQGDEFSGIIGLVNCLRTEADTKNVSCVFIMDKDAPKFDPKSSFYANQLKKGMVINILKNNQWGTYRYVPIDTGSTAYVKHAYINTVHRGELSSLTWLEGNLSINKKLATTPDLVHIYYSALNFTTRRHYASGKLEPEVIAEKILEQDCVLGLEFSGRLNNGRRVMGLAPRGSLSSLITADSHYLWDVPDEWTLEEATTVPVAYVIVLYAFIIQGKIRPGLNILIHCGSDGIGQAAINIALYYKCNVYVTVDSEEKQEFVKKAWPHIKDTHIANSRNTSFKNLILRQTNGKGVDIVLNSLSKENLQANVCCLADGGKLLEIGKHDLSNNNLIVPNMFEEGMSFHNVMLESFFRTGDKIKKLIYDLVDSHIKNGAIKPLSRNIFNENEVEKMFRYMDCGKHIGKVLLQIRTEESEKYIKPSDKLIKAIPRYYCSDVGSHVIVGGLGGLGMELVDWLIIRGARKIILTSRRGITNGYQAMRIKIWKSYGVQIFISTENAISYDGCLNLIKQAMQLGPVETIFNLGVIIKDRVFSNQTKENFIASFGIKAIATKHLDEISRKFCPDLKQFVTFSSVTCGRGNAGQTNYGMSNSVMERICEKRHVDGFPALVIQWGAIGDVGIVAELQEEKADITINGSQPQRLTSFLSCLDKFLCQKQPICSSIVIASKVTNNTASSITEAIKNIIGITNMKTVSENSTLPELGMDSIMIVKIKQVLEKDFRIILTPTEIRSLTFARLSEISTEKDMNSNYTIDMTSSK